MICMKDQRRRMKLNWHTPPGEMRAVRTHRRPSRSARKRRGDMQACSSYASYAFGIRYPWGRGLLSMRAAEFCRKKEKKRSQKRAGERLALSSMAAVPMLRLTRRRVGTADAPKSVPPRTPPYQRVLCHPSFETVGSLFTTFSFTSCCRCSSACASCTPAVPKRGLASQSFDSSCRSPQSDWGGGRRKDSSDAWDGILTSMNYRDSFTCGNPLPRGGENA